MKMLLNLDSSNGGYITVVCVTLYFTRLRLYAVNSKDVHWYKRTIHHCIYLIWFIRFDICAETTKKNHMNTHIEYTGMLLLFTHFDFHNPRLSTSG